MSMWQRFWRWVTNAEEQERQERAHRQVIAALGLPCNCDGASPEDIVTASQGGPSIEWRNVNEPWPSQTRESDMSEATRWRVLGLADAKEGR